MFKSSNCTVNNTNGVMYITFPILEKRGKVKHCFSTKIGGVSEGKYAKMNLSYTNGDKRENVEENFKRICECIGVSTDSLVMSRQTHTANVICINSKDDIIPPDTDGLITNKKGITLCSSYADCVPLIFNDPIAGVIAVAHSGWRGTVQEIGKITVEKMCSEYGAKKENILAVIGPAICMDCYEVDNVVIDKIQKLPYLDESLAILSKPNGKFQLDLKEVCRQTLFNSGILQKNILVSDICTSCNSDFLHSHRATGGERGILSAIIAIK